MVLFLFALVLSALGVAIYGHYNPGALDVTVRGYHFAGVPTWMLLAGAAGVPLFLFLVQAIYASVRIRMLKRDRERLASDRTFARGSFADRSLADRSYADRSYADRSYADRSYDEPAAAAGRQPSPKRSWSTSGD
jgi:hypothetical protein